MRKLSLATFLRRTLSELSASGQSAPYRLLIELEENPRLIDPLCLYVASTYTPEQKSRLLQRSSALQKEFSENTFLGLSGEALEKALEQIPDHENRYKKTWLSYVSVRDRQQVDDHSKALMHKKVRELQEKKHISNYRIYTDLGMNPGNINAWLTHQDCSKVSLDTARKTLKYLQRSW